jgi:Mg-chelatase subunit ChlD
MAKFIGAMDSYIPATIGEKGHKQHGWATTEPFKEVVPQEAFEEMIAQISFQLVRTKDKMPTVIEKYSNLLKNLKEEKEKTTSQERHDTIVSLIKILVKMCAHTRDIVSGKGEYSLAYGMLKSVFVNFPRVGEAILERFVSLEVDGVSVHPYGSWKDIKYFLEPSSSRIYEASIREVKANYKGRAIQLVNEQLRKDEDDMKSGKSISLASKWVPREKSRFGWLFNELARDYFPEIVFTTKLETQAKNMNLCKMKYRKLLSSMNRYLDTTQVKQCEGKWEEIVPEKVTSVTLFRNKKAFLNKDKKGNQRSSSMDRVNCAEHFSTFLDKAKEGKVEVKGKRIGLNEFTKEAIKLILENLQNRVRSEIDMLNLQWKSNSAQNSQLGNFVPLVDVSGSMAGDPLDAAIALGIRIAEKSKLGKRVLTFSAEPKWVNLEGKTEFVEMVAVLQNAEWGMTTNFAKALMLILDVIEKQKMSANDVKEISLVILSDMMINQADKNFDSMYAMIEQNYADVGRRICGEPYTPPHIIFWNLRSTSGFPNLSKQKNTSMLSGFSPMLLNLFCEKGLDCLESLTPWSLLKESLDNPRYKMLDDIVDRNIN